MQCHESIDHDHLAEVEAKLDSRCRMRPGSSELKVFLYWIVGSLWWVRCTDMCDQLLPRDGAVA